MAGARDYLTVEGPSPASYQLPIIDLGSQIARIPQSYFEGQQNAVTRAKQTAFQNGLPMTTDQNGNPIVDINAITNTSAKVGGADYVDKLLPFLFKQQLLQQDQGSGSGPARPNPPAAASPNTGQPPQTWTPMAPTAATGPSGITGEHLSTGGGSIFPYKPGTSPPQIIGGGAEEDGVGLGGQPAPFAGQRTGGVPVGVSGAGQPIGGIGLGNSPRVRQEDTNQYNATASPADARSNGPQSMPGAALTPAGWLQQGGTPQSFVDYANQRARQLAIAGETEAAKIWQSRAAPIMDAIRQAGELTPEQKNARDPGVMNYQLQQEQQKNTVARYGKVYEGINAAASSGAEILPELQLARSLMNQPGFYSGAGEGATLLYKRVLASPIGQAFGADPNAPVPQEAFRKIMAANVLNQVNQLKAESSAVGGGGRIFQAQIELMEKAAQNPDNSVASNRLLTEIGFRGAQRSQQIGDLAANYKGGNLDPGFDKMLRQWQASHPVFTADELRDPRIIAAPVFANVQQAKAAGIRSGAPVKLPDGRIMAMP
jgi:hypothetical protein